MFLKISVEISLFAIEVGVIGGVGGDSLFNASVLSEDKRKDLLLPKLKDKALTKLLGMYSDLDRDTLEGLGESITIFNPSCGDFAGVVVVEVLVLASSDVFAVLSFLADAVLLNGLNIIEMF